MTILPILLCVLVTEVKLFNLLYFFHSVAVYGFSPENCKENNSTFVVFQNPVKLGTIVRLKK